MYRMTLSLFTLGACVMASLPVPAQTINYLTLSASIAPLHARIGMVVNCPGELSRLDANDFRRSYATAKQLGMSFSTLYFMWSELETEEGAYTWGDLDFTMQLLAEQTIRAGFILKIIDTSQLGTYPQDLHFEAFDNPVFIHRLTQFLDALLARYPSQISYLWIGNEIDDYLSTHRAAIPAYRHLLASVVQAVKARFPGVKVGTISTYHDAKKQNALDVIQQVGSVGDIIGFSLYPQFIPGATPASTETYVREMLALSHILHKPLAITETGWSAHGEGGTEARQVEYIHELFRVYRLYRNQLDVLGLFVLYDFPESVTQSLAAQSGVAGDAEFVSFTRFLGYASNDGTPRPAWAALQDELQKFK